MIFCNVCGNPLNDRQTCPECGNVAARASGFGGQQASNTAVVPTTSGFQSNAAAIDAGFGDLPVGGQTTAAKQSGFPKGLLVIGACFGILVIALLIYLAARSQSTSSTKSGSGSANDLATALNRAIENQRLVNFTNDDAYTYYNQLASLNPEHAALSNAKTKVLPQLRNMGEEIIRRKVDHSGEVSEQDWMTLVRAYDWAHLLEPSDKPLEARQEYAQGKLDEAQGRRGEAWQHLLTSTQLDPSWAVPQNDLGYLTTQEKSSGENKWSNAIPYYQRAIGLQPGWEIPYNNMGTAYFYLDNLDVAESYYRQAIDRNSNWARPHKWLGDLYSRKNNLSAAILEYQTAANLYNPSTDSLDINNIQKRITQLHAQGY